MARPFSDIVDRPEQEFSGPTRASCPGVMFRKCRRKIMTRLETEGAAMSINWIAEMSRISADVSRHERVGTERISNQSRNIGERVRQLDWLTAKLSHALAVPAPQCLRLLLGLCVRKRNLRHCGRSIRGGDRKNNRNVGFFVGRTRVVVTID